MHKIIAVQDTDPLTSSDVESPVTRGRSSTVDTRFDQPDSIVSRDKTLDDLNAGIGGSIVRNYDFHVSKALAACRTDCISNEFLAIIVGDDHANVDFRPSAVIPFGHRPFPI
jgi:hypothetical protein